MALQLAIVTPEAEALTIECDEVVVPGVNGDVGFLPGHLPLITGLRPGVLTVVKGGESSYYAVSTGFAEIDDEDRVSVLTSSFEASEQIDLDVAKAALAEAEKKLVEVSGYDAKFQEVERSRLRAQAQIDTLAR